MPKIYYSAVFHIAEDVGGYWVEFPDLPGCFSNGNSIEDAMINATEALGLYLDQSNDLYEREQLKPTSVEEVIKSFPNEPVMLIEYDSIKYAKLHKTKAVKKTLTIPEWLDEQATAKKLNFSRILQEALIAKLESLS